jgi:cytochrome P450
MLKMWASNPKGVVDPQSDTMVLALHVLTAAGFGRSYTFGSGLESELENHSLSYRDSLSLILGNLFTAVFTATLGLPAWMLPSKFKKVQDAVVNFRQYMAEMVEEEREAMNAGAEEQDNLMSILVRASENENKQGKGARHLTDTEIYGNLFSYNLAGHETTSNTLAYATILLAANPKWQKWAAEEVDQVTVGVDVNDLDYDTYYPQLKRVLAIMVCHSPRQLTCTNMPSTKHYDYSEQQGQSPRQHSWTKLSRSTALPIRYPRTPLLVSTWQACTHRPHHGATTL